MRLIRKERGSTRITEGYFAPQSGRTSFVRVDGQVCHLVLVAPGADGKSVEERTEVPRAHGDALLDVCSGKASYERTAVQVGGREALIDRYVAPAPLDIVSVAFDAENEATGFSPPLWFGREVSSDNAYDRHTVALQGAPQAGEVGLTNAALDAVLDLIEPRFGFGRFGGSRAPETGSRDEDPSAALRRMAGPAAQPAAATAPVAAPVEPPEPEVLPQAKAPEPPAPEPKAPEKPPEPKPAESKAPEAKPAEAPAPQPEAKPAKDADARMDDVFESLSQALGAAIQPAAPAPAAKAEEDPGASFERWTVRPRRNLTPN
ncbi:hypothetical protein AwMethylo_09570 [Methylobacterium sp.]|nr:hypothetical protein AwMethylo_09570 [Methylobacterium sp.]